MSDDVLNNEWDTWRAQMTLLVSGHSFQIPSQQDAETYSLDLGSAMSATMPESLPGREIAARPVPRRNPDQADNSVVMYASGQRSSSAYILLGDASVLP